MTDTSSVDVPLLVQGFLSNLMKACSAELPETDFDWYELDYGEELQLDRIDQMLSIQKFDNDIELAASRALDQTGVDLSALSLLHRRQLLEGIARAKREAIYYQKHLRSEPFSKYVYQDSAFIPSEPNLSANGAYSANYPANSKPLSKFVEAYLSSDANGWADATRKEKQVPLGWFMEQVGAERDIRSIGSSDVIAYRDAMLRLRKHVTRGTSLKKAQTDVLSKRVHAKTARKKFDTVMAFLRWLQSIGEIDVVPANGISIKVPKTPKTKQRRPFEPDELDQVFTSPLYSGCRSLARRSRPGNVIHLDDHYWMPLVLLYTGMRISEPLQLVASDVFLDVPHPYIRLDGDKYNLKTAAADRVVPIHPDLLAFGFGEFAAARRKKAPKQRLFRKITSKGDVGGYYSKKLGRYLGDIGLTDPRLVAHSFRHGFKTALRNAAVPEGEQHFLMGHSDSSTAHGYGVASDIKVLHHWVSKINFGLSQSTRQLLQTNKAKGAAN